MSADAEMVLIVTVPVIAALTLALALCSFLVTAYRKRNEALWTLCSRYQDMAKTAEHKARRAQIAYCLAETQAAVEMAHKDRELRINRELMRQYDRNRRGKEEPA